MATQTNSSPGVYTSEKDLTFTTETIGVTTLGLVGETMKGPAFQPMFVKNYDEFKLKFAGTNPEKFRNTQIVKYELPYIAKSYLGQSNQLFVTRILGLSGYDAGTSYALRTIGSCDTGTYTTGATTVDTSINFTVGTGGTFYVSGSTTLLVDQVATVTGTAKTKFLATFNTFFNRPAVYTNKNWYKMDIMHWGVFETDQSVSITAARELSKVGTVNSGTTANYVDAYQYDSILVTDATLKKQDVLLNEFLFSESTDLYSGKSFALYAYNIVTGTTISGTLHIEEYPATCSPYMEYHKKIAATLKSRGIYVSDKLYYNINPTNGNTVAFGTTTGINNNPFGDFTITGTTGTDLTAFSYSGSLDITKKNYIKNVLGVSIFDKDPYLYVEEVYDATIKKGYLSNKIQGLHYAIQEVSTWNHYKFQFQSPETPYFVSELRGGLPQRLFKLISISDGSNANNEIKVSIANVDLDKKSFDIYIRAYNDLDKTPVYLEKFLSLNMNETSDNYVGRRIGTLDNKYPLKSSYVIADMADNAPIDGVASGFEGYEFRTYNEGTGTTDASYCGVPELPYKTKYYASGEVMFAPAFSTPTISNGDKVRKTFLGFSDTEFGFDGDLLKYKGKYSLTNTYNDGSDWSTQTKGFHLDVDASGVTDNLGEMLYSTGIGTFTDAYTIATTSTHPYYDIKTRKFTALFSGGFDGWDIYREQRTNLDDFKIGRTRFNNSVTAFTTITNLEYEETFGTSDYYAFLYGLKTFQNPEQTSINVLATPGIDIINNSELVKDAIEIIEEKRKDSIYIPTLPDMKLIGNTSPSNTDDWYFATDIVDLLAATEIDSNYTAVLYPWLQTSDTENNANVFIPSTAEFVKNLAYTDNVAHPWYAVAGYNRGVVKSLRARMAIDQEKRDILYDGRINPIATFSDVGTVIWGNRNLQISNSALNRLNIRRLLLEARKLIVSVSNRLLFDPNDTQVRSQFLSSVNPILDSIRKERGLTDFRVKLEPETSDSDRNTMKGKIFIKPVDALEYIELEFVVTPTSVSFDNI